MTNIYNLFKFLEDKKGRKIPFNAKLLHAPEVMTDEDLNVEGSLNLFNNSKITSLPDNLKVEGSLYLGSTKITSLPNNLQVGGGLHLSYSQISSIPNNLQAEGDLTVSSTPLIGKYNREEIIQMIYDKGGYVRGLVYVGPYSR